MLLRNKVTYLLGGAILMGAMSFSAQAKTFRYAIGYPSGAPVEAANVYAAEIEEKTNKKHKVRVHEMSLLSISEMADGVSKGLTDIGYLLTAYFPSEYQHLNLGADMSMLTALKDEIPNQEGFAYAGAMLEYVMLNCDECQDEFKTNNQVFTGTVATPKYVLFCNKPVTSEEDIKGKRIRIAGAPWARWAKNFGAQPVTNPLNEAYESLSQGVIDCTFLSPTELSNYNLIEVVKHIVTDVPGGLYAAGGTTTINKKNWDKMTPEEKQIFFDAGALMTAEVTYRFQKRGEQDLVDAAEKGITITKASDSLLQNSQNFIREDLLFVPEFYAKEYKMDPERTKELAAKMTELTEKWYDIIANADIQSASDLRDVYIKEVYSKIDVDQYGN